MTSASRHGARWSTNVATHPSHRSRRAARLASLCASAVAAVASLFHSAAHSADDGQTLFDAGRIAFERGDYAAALADFEAAARAGLAGPAVQFNIGVAAFRARDYARAETAFEETARTEAMAPLAHYNLALVALERGETEIARKWLARVEEESTDERLRDLASKRLAALPPPSQRTWFGYAALGGGYDDNVALVSSSDVLGVSGIDDAFTEAQVAFGVPLGDWAIDAGMFYLDYQDLDEFDQLGVHGTGRYRLELGGWTNELAAQLAYTTLDGEGFENRREVGLRTGRELVSNWRLRVQYRYADIEGLNRFTGVSGHGHEASVRTMRTNDRWDIALEYRFEVDDHQDENLSAKRQQLALAATRRLTSSWSLSFDAMLRQSRYDVEANGDEDLTELALALGRTFGSRWRLVLRYAYTDNSADRPEFNYERNRIAAAVEAVL